MVKKSKKKSVKKDIWKIFTPLIVAIAGGLGLTLAITTNQGKIELKIDYAPEPVMIEGQGEYEEEVPTIDEIDGG